MGDCRGFLSIDLVQYAGMVGHCHSRSDNARPHGAIIGNQDHVRKAPVFLAWVADLSRLERAAQREDKPDIVLGYLDFFLVSVIDAALAAQNAAIAFEAAGLGITYIGGIRNHVKEVAKTLALPPRSFVAFGMCVGWPTRPIRPVSSRVCRKASCSIMKNTSIRRRQS